MDFTDQICCWGIKLFYGNEIRQAIKTVRNDATTDATKVDETVDAIFKTTNWEQDSWTAVKKAAIKDVFKESLREQKAALLGSMLSRAQSLWRLSNPATDRLTPESADHLSSKLRRQDEYKIFKPYEISYLLRNFSAASTVLAQDKIIGISSEGNISHKGNVNRAAKRQSCKWVDVFHHYAKGAHEKSKETRRDLTKHYSEQFDLSPESVDNMIYKILYQVSPKFSGLSSHEQVVKAIENKDPEILCKAYQTLKAHLQNPQKPTDPYQRRIL